MHGSSSLHVKTYILILELFSFKILQTFIKYCKITYFNVFLKYYIGQAVHRTYTKNILI